MTGGVPAPSLDFRTPPPKLTPPRKKAPSGSPMNLCAHLILFFFSPHTIPPLTSQAYIKWHTIRIISKGRRHKSTYKDLYDMFQCKCTYENVHELLKLKISELDFVKFESIQLSFLLLSLNPLIFKTVFNALHSESNTKYFVMKIRDGILQTITELKSMWLCAQKSH